MDTKKFIEEMFAQNLDGVKAYVSCGGVDVKGGIEQKCILRYVKYFGLSLSTTLEWNNLNGTKPVNQISQLLKDSMDRLQAGVTYEQRDSVLDYFETKLKNVEVSIGMISCNGIKNISLKVEKEVLQSVEILYDNGNTCIIRNIEQIKK